tara:strand:+ start:31968 stop:32156 length:189 start_codon:yes stop_codon:yes gene_type:complete
MPGQAAAVMDTRLRGHDDGEKGDRPTPNNVMRGLDPRISIPKRRAHIRAGLKPAPTKQHKRM